MRLDSRMARWAVVLGVMAGATAVSHAKDFKPFAEVSKDYEKVISTADGSKPLYTVWVDKKKNQVLAELPSGWKRDKYLIAVTQSSGNIFAGLMGPSRYVYWKRFDDRLALIAPEIGTRSKGEAESKKSVERLFTDTVIAEVPIVAMGPGGQPVIDLDDMLVNKATVFVGPRAKGINARLARIVSAKAFPENIEIEMEAPDAKGKLSGLHYSISKVPDKTGYKPRLADERVGYFTTVFRDLGQYDQEKKWVRYIDRWHLEKRDAKLKMSPPKEPIVFYLEHTVPVRYRRFIRQGVLYWNEAFEQVGIVDAIEVRYQDANSGAHMDKDPEDVRYNFIRWLNNDISTAIGPHRSHPLTGQILDADVVLTDGWIRAYWGWFYEQAPELAVESMSAETLEWLESYPEWDPRLLLVSPKKRNEILTEREQAKATGQTAPGGSDPAIAMNEDLASIGEWVGEHHHCLAAHGLAFDMAFSQMHLAALGLDMAEETPGEPVGEKLDGIPEWFVGPLLAELVAHEVGHTLGLRHNFKASSVYTLEQINSEEWKGKKTIAGSVMDYLPPNFNMESGELQGDFTMIGVGPYDMWAIEYGYTMDDPKKVLSRVSEPELAYLTDDDTGGPDPLARRYDFSKNPLDYAKNQMRIVDQQRGQVVEKFVKDGQSWSKARRGYELTLSMQMRMLSMMANWVGGTNVNRDRKSDPGDRAPITVVDPEEQRAALEWVINNCFQDEAFGLTPELLAYMTVDKWSDQSPGDRGDPTWPVHERIMGIQGSTLTMIMNPSTMRHVYDNEFRTPSEEDALTVPELMDTLYDAIYGELGMNLNGKTFTERESMISSFRRNLQSTMTDRLIRLSSGDNRLPRPIRTLAAKKLRELDSQLDRIIDNKKGQVDRYTMAHVEDLKDRVTKALNRMYVSEF